jgi:hypothetical protein
MRRATSIVIGVVLAVSLAALRRSPIVLGGNMKALLAALAIILLLGATISPVAAAQVVTCSVTPESAPAGSTFIASCSGFQPRDSVIVGWAVQDSSGREVFYTNHLVVADGSGALTDSQAIPVAGNGHLEQARLCQGHCKQYSGLTPYFTVTP